MLADLGLAQAPGGPSMRSQMSEAMPHPGTPAYMSPEQTRPPFAHLSPASDIYSLGAVLFEILTGRVYKNIRPGTPVTKFRQDVPDSLVETLNRMLASTPEMRPWDGDETAELLHQATSNNQKPKIEPRTPMAAGKTNEQRDAEEKARRAAEEKERKEAAKQAKLEKEKAEQARRAFLRKLKVPETIKIPAGEFLMGSDKKNDPDTFDNETPQHRVYVDSFEIGKYPVTNDQYAVFVSDTGKEPPNHWKNGIIPKGKLNHPVVYISWYDAIAYCQWLSEKTGEPWRLPTEAEWEKAARGVDGRIYPWGNVRPDRTRCNFNRNVGDTTPVGEFPAGASPYGVLDMAGNVWEWTSSLYKPYPYNFKDGREDAKANGRRVLRGGSWDYRSSLVRSAFRGDFIPDSRVYGSGFRPVRSS